MLSDRERETWREIQHQLVHDLDWTRTVHSVERRAPGDHHRLTDPGTVLAALTLIVALLVGPNPLTRTEFAARQQSPEPHRASLLSQPAAAVDYPQDAALSPASRIAPSAAA
jgi:hypothetical protein